MSGKSNSKVISLSDSKRLMALEETVLSAKRATLDAASALWELWDSGLWDTGEFNNFEAYCRKKFEIGRSQAYRLIDAHKTVKLLANVPHGGQISSERTIRALNAAPENQRLEIVNAVSSAGQITAKAIRQEIAKRNPRPAPAIKPARVIDIQPIEQVAAVEYDINANRLDAGTVLVKELHDLANDLEMDLVMPQPGDEVDFAKYGERLVGMARRVMKLNPISK